MFILKSALVLFLLGVLLALPTYLPKIERKQITVAAKEIITTPTTQEPAKVQEQTEEVKKAIAQEEEMSNPKPKEEPKPEPKPAPQATGKTPIEQGVFARGQTGQYLIDYVRGNPNGAKLYNAFEAKHGERIAKKAAISLYYENGSLWELTTGVCSAKYQINGDYRNCNYADTNSAGFDAGLKQINTWYQRKRIAKLGGPDCTPVNSRDRSDECTKQLIAWLHNVDNNIAIALDIYAESGFGPWYGARRAGIDNYS